MLLSKFVNNDNDNDDDNVDGGNVNEYILVHSFSLYSIK